MKYIIAALLLFMLAELLWLFGPKVVRTGWLMATVSPYEQVGMGDESILILGDSTGYGTGASNKNDSVAGRLGADYPQYSIKNNSENGRTIGELVEMAREVEGNYKMILLQIGGNDILQKRDVETVEGELREIVSLLSDDTENLYMISTGNVGASAVFLGTPQSAEYEAITNEYRAMFKRVEADTELHFVDLFLEREDDPFISEPKKYNSIDGLHPSSAGYGLWYEILKGDVDGVL